LEIHTNLENILNKLQDFIFSAGQIDNLAESIELIRKDLKQN